MSGSRRSPDESPPAAAKDEVELAVVEWIGWYNHRRLHSSLDDLPPAEYEEINYKKVVLALDAPPSSDEKGQTPTSP